MNENKRIPYSKECPYQRTDKNLSYKNLPYCAPMDTICVLCIKGNSRLFNELEAMRKNGNREVEKYYYGEE